MGTPPYIMSHLMLEEHRHNVERAILISDWPDPVPVTRPPRLLTIRQHGSSLLRALADRLDQAGALPGVTGAPATPLEERQV